MLVYNNTMTKNNKPDSPSSLKFSVLPAARGVAWLGLAWTMLRTQALRLLLISLFFQFFLSFAQAGMLGLVVILCLPVLSAGMLHSLHSVDLGKRPILMMLFAGFSNSRSLSKLLLLGAIVMIIGLLVVTLVMSGQVMNLDPDLLDRNTVGLIVRYILFCCAQGRSGIVRDGISYFTVRATVSIAGVQHSIRGVS